MKAERRHELESNTLAALLAQGIQRYRDYLPAITFVLVGMVAIVVTYNLWASRGRGSHPDAWHEYYSAVIASDQEQVIDRLKQVASRYPETPVALWIRLDLADLYADQGRRRMESDRDTALARLREAEQIYAEVLESPQAVPEMIRRAALPRVACLELMGERLQAIESYQAIAATYAAQFPEMAKEAASRASGLERPEAADFYKWLAERKPTPSKTLTPPSLDPLFPPLRSEPDTPGSTPELDTRDGKPAEGEESPKEGVSEADPAAKPSGEAATKPADPDPEPAPTNTTPANKPGEDDSDQQHTDPGSTEQPAKSPD
jgi:hypothetical protein